MDVVQRIVCIDEDNIAKLGIYNFLHPLPNSENNTITRKGAMDLVGIETIVALAKQESIFIQKLSYITTSEGVDLKSKRIIWRDRTVEKIMDRLYEKNVLLIKSPPMTGKTSLGFLVADHLKTKYPRNSLILHLSTIRWIHDAKSTFDIEFQRSTGFTWNQIIQVSNEVQVYVIIDEVQLLYQRRGGTRPDSPCFKSKSFWYTVKDLMQHKSNLKILLLAAYGSSSYNSEYATPATFHKGETMFGFEDVKFTEEELKEYVVKNLMTNSENPVNVFNNDQYQKIVKQLHLLTGSHVGLCVTAINSLNSIFRSRVQYSLEIEIEVLMRELWSSKVFKDLIGTRAVAVIDSLLVEEMDFLKRIVCENAMQETLSTYDYDIVSLVQKGVLVDTSNEITFSSVVMKQLLHKHTFGTPIERSSIHPSDLSELIQRIFSSMNYSNIAHSFGKTKVVGIPLERTWQMEFYKTMLQCLPHSYFVSADVGGIFDVRGSIDFTVHAKHDNETTFWGIEMLRERDQLEEHVDRFQDDGRYKNLITLFTDFCIVDVRSRCSSIDGIRNDVGEIDILFVVTFNETYTDITLYSKLTPNGKKVSITEQTYVP